MARQRLSREQLIEAPEPASCSTRRVRLQEVDAAGIVFFARYLELFHDSLFDYLEERGCAPRDLLEDAELIAPIGHAEADYLRPLRHGERFDVAPVLALVEDDRAVVGYRIRSRERREIVAVGQTIHFGVDAESFERSALPPAFAAALRELPRP